MKKSYKKWLIGGSIATALFLTTLVGGGGYLAYAVAKNLVSTAKQSDISSSVPAAISNHLYAQIAAEVSAAAIQGTLTQSIADLRPYMLCLQSFTGKDPQVVVDKLITYLPKNIDAGQVQQIWGQVNKSGAPSPTVSSPLFACLTSAVM